MKKVKKGRKDETVFLADRDMLICLSPELEPESLMLSEAQFKLIEAAVRESQITE